MCYSTLLHSSYPSVSVFDRKAQLLANAANYFAASLEQCLLKLCKNVHRGHVSAVC